MAGYLHVGVATVRFREPMCWACGCRLQTDALMSHKPESKHRAGLTAPAETSADAIYTLRSFHFPHNDITRLLNACFDLRGIIQNYLRIVPRNGDKCGNREAVTIYDDGVAVPVNLRD